LTDTSFLGFKKDLIVDVENAESQRRAEIRRRRIADRYIAEQQRRQLDEQFARRRAEREQQIRIKVAAEERWQRRKQAQLEDEEARGHTNRALLFFMAKKKVFLKEFDKIKTAAEAEAIRNPGLEDACVVWMQKTGTSVTSLSDMSRIIERNGLKRLADDFIEEHGMSPKSKKYFSAWVAPLLQPRTRRDIDDIRDLTRIMARAGAGFGNQDLANALLPKLMTDISPGLQAHPEQNFMMAYQPQIAHIQVNQYDPRRNLENAKNMTAAIGYAPQSQSRERVQDRKINEVVENILKSMGPSARARRGPDGSLMIYWPVADHG